MFEMFSIICNVFFSFVILVMVEPHWKFIMIDPVHIPYIDMCVAWQWCNIYLLPKKKVAFGVRFVLFSVDFWYLNDGKNSIPMLYNKNEKSYGTNCCLFF